MPYPAGLIENNEKNPLSSNNKNDLKHEVMDDNETSEDNQKDVISDNENLDKDNERWN